MFLEACTSKSWSIPKNSKNSKAEGAKTMQIPQKSIKSKVFQTIGLRAGIRPGVEAGE